VILTVIGVITSALRHYRVNNRFSRIDRRCARAGTILLRHPTTIRRRHNFSHDLGSRRFRALVRPTTPISAVRGPPTIGSGRRQAAVQFAQSAHCSVEGQRAALIAVTGPEFSSVALVTPAVSNNMKQQLDVVSDNRCFGGQQKVYEHDRSVATLCVVLLLSMYCTL